MKYKIKELSLVVPTKDDHLKIEKNLNSVITFLNDFAQDFQILIISNGSSKKSTIFIDNLIETFDYIEHIKIIESGKGLAVREGIINAKYNNVLFSDADFSVKISEFNKFVFNGELKSPFVIGNRRNKNSVNKKTPVTRKISGAIYIKFLRILFNINFEDTQCGFKAVDKSRFLGSSSFNTNGFSFDVELLLIANKENIKITEEPVEYIHDRDSKVFLLRDTFKMINEIVKIKNRI